MIGTVESLWRYPVKSMRGEELEEVFVGFGGIRGDRLFAFRSSAARPEFPYFTARQQPRMLQFRPRLVDDGKSVEVETPDGRVFAIDDPALIEELRRGVDPKHEVSLMRSDSALADSHPVSMLSIQTAARVLEGADAPMDKRHFRESIYLDLPAPYAEDEFVGRDVRLGADVVIAVEELDSRCMMINLHPDTTAAQPSILKYVGKERGGMAGVYGRVRMEGVVHRGDPVVVL
ncbi:MAG TPA: MOSC N-terminal beta barrel domain-containing protein [Chthoniobacterales bacterium]|nr:MOSC N-terminal beta barrel domain-containing protein [Chthoniobacterales bacterium]